MFNKSASSSAPCDLPNGEFVWYRNHETGAYMLVPPPVGFHLVEGGPDPQLSPSAPPSELHQSPGSDFATSIPPGSQFGTSLPRASGFGGSSVPRGHRLNASFVSERQTPAARNDPPRLPVATASSTPIGTSRSRNDGVPETPRPRPFNIENPYAPEDGNAGQLHANAALHPENLVKMELYGASSRDSKVCRILFRPQDNTAKMDTREDVQFPPSVVDVADFLNAGKASTNLILVFATGRKDTINVDPRIWSSFTEETSLMAIYGTLHPEELTRLIPALQNISTLNIVNQKFLTPGCLNDFSRFIPPNITHFMFDTRHTSNTTLIENVMALYGDLFLRQRKRQPCFKSLTLVVTDFCKRDPFLEQVKRLSEMLIDDTSVAVVYTLTPGDDTILDALLALEFKRVHSGYLSNFEKHYELFHFWTTTIFGKPVTFGFLDPAVVPVPEKDAPKI